MPHSYDLLGLDTLELIGIGHEKSPAMSWGLWDHEGPTLNLRLLGYGEESLSVMLTKDLLEKLYSRFAEANPTGTVITINDGCLKYAPPELSQEEVMQLYDDEKLFPDLAKDINYSLLRDPNRDTPLHRYLPELRQPEVLERLANDPEVSLRLFNQAFAEGALPKLYGSRHWRWSPEWAAYVEAYRKAHPPVLA